MIKNITVEVCCGSIEDVRTASRFNIDRMELNSALELGGLTPSIGTLIEAKKCTDKPICCMVRPRGAGFVYSEEQILSMFTDAELLLKHGADGIVFGFLKEDDTVDEEHTRAMCTLIHEYHKEAVFHKAFDLTKDMDQAIQTLIHCGVDRILTAGGENNIMDQLNVLTALQANYADKIQILPGGGVRSHNIQKILKETCCRQIHMSAREKAEDHGSYDTVSPAHLSSILNNI